jgi:hypothetical protein
MVGGAHRRQGGTAANSAWRLDGATALWVRFLRKRRWGGERMPAVTSLSPSTHSRWSSPAVIWARAERSEQRIGEVGSVWSASREWEQMASPRRKDTW